MLLIGLTGPSGAGKGAFCRILLDKYGIPSIDADALYHALLVPPSPCLDVLANVFGGEILNPDGTLNRKALASIVFSSGEEAVRQKRIEELNSITHHFVLNRTDALLREMEASGVKAAIFDAPALYESGADQWCHLLVTVLADKETRIQRITERDGLTREAAEMRVRAQHPDEFYTKNAHAVLLNNGTPAEFEAAVSAFYKKNLQSRLS